MTETRTTRLNLPQWSSGGDSPGRGDFNGAFADLEARAAIDRHPAHADLPSAGLVPREYFQRLLDLGGGTVLRSLYRTDEGSTWRSAGAWVPETLRVRPPDATPPAIGTDGLRVEHPSHATAGLTSSWDGAVKARTSLVLGNVAEPTLGRLSVGNLDAIPASVRARITAFGAERALEIKAGDANVTELLRLINSAGSNVLTVSGAGALSSTQGAAFGGISPAANASLTVAPQSSGAIDTGLLGYGQESANTRAILNLNRYQPGSSDTASILSALPNKITVGRTGAWSGGAVDIGAPTMRVVTPRLAWFPSEDSLDGASGFNPFPGLTGFAGFDSAMGLYTAVGTEFNNFGDPSKIAMEFASYESATNVWTGDLFRAYQCQLVSGNPDAVNVSRMDPQGRLSLNASWRGSGNRPVELRDARQSIVHESIRVWAVPGDYPAGLFIGQSGNVTYSWPTMTVRSNSITQLEVEMRLEALFHKLGSGPDVDRQVLQLEWYYQIAGGSWILASSAFQEAAATVVASAFPQAPGIQNVWTVTVPVTAAAGTTFRIRFKAYTYPYASTCRLRRADLKVRESIVQTYATVE